MAKTFATAAMSGLTDAATRQGQSTKPSTSSDNLEHKRKFLETYKRWSRLFKGKDGNLDDEKWLIAEYYKALGHLSERGLEVLTERLIPTCTFFPTIKECLDAIHPAGPYDWGHPFLDAPQMFQPRQSIQRLEDPRAALQIEAR